jgi:hypothetical protein
LGVCWLAFVLQSFFGALLCISFTSWVLMGTDESLSFVDATKKKKNLITKNGTEYQCNFFFSSILFCYWRYTQQICIWILQSSNPKTLCSVFFFVTLIDGSMLE